MGGGEDIRTLAALTANRRVSPTALGSLDAEPYPVAKTAYYEANGWLLADRLDRLHCFGGFHGTFASRL